MEKYQSELLIIASRLLDYPSFEEKQDVIACINHMNASDHIKNEIGDAVNTVYRLPLQELRETYVATFDLKRKFGLYLSAHEFGDSPKRGAALIKLQKMVNKAGFERDEGELADYIPMLFEFLAIAEAINDKERLIKRLGCAIQLIQNDLPAENPYYPLIAVLMRHMFEPPTKEELQKLNMEREEADLEELPYPIMYT